MYAHISKDKKAVVVSTSLSWELNPACRWLSKTQATRLLRQLEIALAQMESAKHDSPIAST